MYRPTKFHENPLLDSKIMRAQPNIMILYMCHIYSRNYPIFAHPPLEQVWENYTISPLRYKACHIEI
jgi:hypothetical protein